MSRLKEDMREISVEYAKSFSDVGKSVSTVLTAGLSDEVAKAIAGEAAKLSAVTGASMESVSKIMTDSMIAYRGGLHEIAQLTDRLYTISRHGRVGLEELSGSFSKVATTGASVGATFEDVITAITMMTRGGAKADEAISAVDRVLLNFAKGGSKQARQSARELGIEMNTVALRNEGLISILDKLSKATDTQAVNIAGSANAVRALSRAIGESGDYMALYEEIIGSSGATQEAFNEVSQTSAFIFEQQKQEMLATFTAIAEDIMPVLLSAQKVLVNFINILGGKAVARTLIFGSALFVLLNNLNKFIIATRKNIAAQEASKKATDAMTAAQIRQKAATDALKASFMTLWPAMLSMVIGFAISKIMDLAEKTREAKEELDGLIVTEADLKKRATEASSATTERVAKLQANIVKIREYAKEVMNTKRSEETRNRALENYNRLSREMVNSAPELFGFLGVNIKNVNSLANEWQKVAQGLNNASVELDKFQKLTIAEAEMDVASKELVDARGRIRKLQIEADDFLSQMKVKYGAYGDKLGGPAGELVFGELEGYFREQAEIDLEKELRGIKARRAGDAVAVKLLSSLEKYIIKPQPRTRWIDGTEVPIDYTLVDVLKLVDIKAKDTRQYKEIFDRMVREEKNLKTAQDFYDKVSKDVYDMYQADPGLEKRYQTWGAPEHWSAGGVSEAAEKGRRPSFDTFFSALKREWERGTDSTQFKRDFDLFGVGVKKSLEDERRVEQQLIEAFNEELQDGKYEMTDEQIKKYSEDFIAWFWNWKKDKFKKYLGVLRKKLEDPELSVEENKEIVAEKNLVEQELLIGLSQYMGYKVGDDKLIEVTDLMIDYNKGVIYQLKEIEDIIDTETEEGKEIKEGLESAVVNAQDVGTSMEHLGIITAYIKDKNVTSESLIRRFGEETEKLLADKTPVEYLSQFVENIEDADDEEMYALVETALASVALRIEERYARLDETINKIEEYLILKESIIGEDKVEMIKVLLSSLRGGKFIAEMEDIIHALDGIDDLADLWYKHVIEKIVEEREKIVREFLHRVSAHLFGDAKDLDELTADEIDQLLQNPFVNEEVKAVLQRKMDEMKATVSAFDRETEKMVLKIYEDVAERERDIRDKIEGRRLFPSIGALFRLMSPFKESAEDIERKERRIRYERLKEDIADNWDLYTEEEQLDKHEELLDMEMGLNEDMAENVMLLVDSMKETWTLYYDWQMQKIQEWYNEQTRIIDNKTRFEFRSALWAEKEKEKLDKEREKREKKLAYVEKGIAVTTAIINTALAVSRTYKDFQFPLNLVISGIMAALGGAQVALISQQKFESGGYVIGKRHSEGGVPIEVEGGEYVINRQATAKYRDILEHINEYGKSGRTQDAYIFEQGGAVSNVESSTRYINDPATTGILASIATAIKRLDIQVQVNAKTITDIELWKKTVKGQRLAKVM